MCSQSFSGHVVLIARSLVALAWAALALPVHAITLSLAGPATPVAMGESFTIDVEVSDLGDGIVSAFDLDIVFDADLFTADDVAFGAMLGGPDDSSSGAAIAAGRVDLFELSFLSDMALADLQGDSLILATLFVTAAGPGAATFAFDAETPPGLDVKGAAAARLEFDAVDGFAVDVESPPTDVPEPAPIALLAAALGLMALSRALASPVHRRSARGRHGRPGR